MKILSAFTLALTVLLLVPTAFAGDEVILKNGDSGVADVVETTEDSVTVKYIVPEGPTATIGLKADQLDPNNFYTLRNKFMENTVENHLKLARFCVENELFSRAQIQIKKARDIDETQVDLILDDAEVKEAIAERLLRYVAREMKTGDMAEAEKWLHVLLTRLPDTEAAEIARANLDKVDEAREARQAKEAADRQAAIEAEQDAQKKEDAKKKATALDPIYKHLDAGEKMASAALKERNASTQKKALEAAGMHFEAAVQKVQDLRKEVGDSRELDQIEQEAKNNAVTCYLNAGRIDMSKRSLNNADKWAVRALRVDPNSAAAKSFREQLALSASLGGWGRRF